MVCTLRMSATPGAKFPGGKTLEITSTLARKTIDVVGTIADVRSAAMDFGKETHAAHPDASFYVFVSVVKGRKPNGFDAADKAEQFGQETYLKMEEPKPCPASS